MRRSRILNIRRRIRSSTSSGSIADRQPGWRQRIESRTRPALAVIPRATPLRKRRRRPALRINAGSRARRATAARATSLFGRAAPSRHDLGARPPPNGAPASCLLHRRDACSDLPACRIASAGGAPGPAGFGLAILPLVEKRFRFMTNHVPARGNACRKPRARLGRRFPARVNLDVSL
ncbi:hypothetical protein Bpla01_62050 [Burkholderia plantarii]|nr:hypothetical protein Bpla01_62050 [Burkholderia plantarii]